MSNILKLVNGKNSITGTQKGKLTTLRIYFLAMQVAYTLIMHLLRFL